MMLQVSAALVAEVAKVSAGLPTAVSRTPSVYIQKLLGMEHCQSLCDVHLSTSKHLTLMSGSCKHACFKTAVSALRLDGVSC